MSTAAAAAGADKAPGTTAEPVPRLRVRDLRVGFRTPHGHREVVRDVSFDLWPGRCVALVGESGSGKSVTARSLVGLVGGTAQVSAGELSLDGQDLLRLDDRGWRAVRGRRIGVVLQDALVSLDPLRPVGREIGEALRLHGWGTPQTRGRRVLDLLRVVGVAAPEVRARQRPDQLSGGLRQRALIASAVALDPDVVIADEPTTALDVTVQAQVLGELDRMKRQGVALVLISHDLSVVASLADDVVVMTGGAVVEQGPAADLLRDPRHPYTRRLVAAVPGLHTRDRRLSPDPLPAVAARRAIRRGAAEDGPVLEAVDLVKAFTAPGGRRIVAVDGVSFELARGRTLGIVGESGSGKSTTARLALALDRPDAGHVRLLGQDWSVLPENRRRPLRRRITVVQQDPLSAFDPRWTVERILADAVGRDTHPAREDRRRRVRDLVDLVGLDASVLTRFPLRLSGGQRQRVAIARALAPDPDVVVLDEAVSALDVSIQAQILDLLRHLQISEHLSYLFISHDLGVVGHVSDEVLVMSDGAVVEHGPTEQVLTRPAHPYTRRLVADLPPALPAPEIGVPA